MSPSLLGSPGHSRHLSCISQHLSPSMGSGHRPDPLRTWVLIPPIAGTYLLIPFLSLSLSSSSVPGGEDHTEARDCGEGRMVTSKNPMSPRHSVSAQQMSPGSSGWAPGSKP
jgi:hypothetical protein